MLLIGGFLGAGKTTLIGHFSRWLKQRGLKVALVTNDQGRGLMDTDSARRAASNGGVEEISGGCFCCRLDDLVGAVGRLETEARPDVIVAEPVGSCTDLMATVILPLERVYTIPFVLSPLSVVLDARRALAALGGRRKARDFHRDVGYVFRKQIEEAEWLVVNKVDLLEEEDMADLEGRMARAYPEKRVFRVSGKTGAGLEEWFTALMEDRSAPQEVMEVDYERYGRGEALLGWVNSEAHCQVIDGAGGDFDWGAWLMELGRKISARLEEQGFEVGHFKMSVETGDRRWRLHQAMSGENPTLHQDDLETRADADGRLLVNLRAEGEAARLSAIVDQALQSQRLLKVEFLDRAAFQPGKPQPTHRLAASMVAKQ
jgi:G3E family GTPase